MKKFLLLICLLFFTGCSVKYNLDFKDDKLIENISFLSASNEEYNLIKKKEFAPVPAFVDTPVNLEEPLKTDGFEYYSLKAHSNNVYMNYKFDKKNYGNSYMASLCYDYFKFFETDEDYVISTGNKFNCSFSTYEFDVIDVVITTNHEVLYSNAHEVNGDEYIWHISDANKDNANIQISFSKDVVRTGFEKFIRNNSVIIIIVGLSMLLLGIMFVLFIRVKNKQVNKI